MSLIYDLQHFFISINHTHINYETCYVDNQSKQVGMSLSRLSACILHYVKSEWKSVEDGRKQRVGTGRKLKSESQTWKRKHRNQHVHTFQATVFTRRTVCVGVCTTDLQFEQLIALVRRIMRIKEAAGQIWMRLDETHIHTRHYSPVFVRLKCETDLLFI